LNGIILTSGEPPEKSAAVAMVAMTHDVIVIGAGLTAPADADIWKN
jgi:hypothetical protein